MEQNSMSTAGTKFALREYELVTVLLKSAVEVSSDSPLSSLPLEEGLGDLAPTLNSAEQQVLRIVCRPVLDVAVLLSPPHGQNLVWAFDGGRPSDPLAGYYLDAKGYHCFQEIGEPALLDAIGNALHVKTPAGPGEFRIVLRPDDLRALLGLVDANREQSLRSLLDRLPDGDRTFSLGDISGFLETGLKEGDQRWLTSVIQALTPFDLTGTPELTAAAFERLAQLGLLEPQVDESRLTDSGRVLCTALATPIAYAALHGRLPGAANSIRREHIAAFRTLECLWLLSFQNLDSANPTIELRPVSGEEAELAFSERLFEWRQAARQSAQSRERPCGACGGAVAKDAKFCRHCGKPVVTPNAAPIQEARHCPNPSCGRVIIPGKKFCVACGTALEVSFGPQELEAVPQAASKEQRCGNPSCRAVIPSGKKFCPSCGQPVGGHTQSAGIIAARLPSSKRCPTCGEEVAAGKKFCRNDGTRID